MAEFTAIGKHCSISYCNQHDFLPFVCDCCEKVYCLQHRSYAAHECLHSGSKNMTAILCPLCNKAIRLSGSQDANQEWERHSRTDCSPEKNTKKPRKRCSVQGCREILGLTNMHKCSKCHSDVCMSHRYPDAHKCSTVIHQNRTSFVAKALPMEKPILHQNRDKPKPNYSAENSLRGSVSRRQTNSSNIHPSKTEKCLECGVAFDTVAELILHSERAHFAKSFENSSSIEKCPICSMQFGDPVELVNHVQNQHHNRICTPAHRTDGSKCSVT